ncbi:putative Leucine Rich repeats (2 copies) [Trypanosoma vivax]|nr:putative Leucine Rich repeats (2 copies) [Trypanosoma vivax]
MVEMTREVLVAACKSNGGYAAPRLNDQLFLQCRGFLRIENLEEYVNLKVLWLEQNAISDFTGVEALQQLVSLFLQNNTISSLRTLPTLCSLRVLNLSHNYLTSLSGIAKGCPLLETFQASHNRISTLSDCSDLWGLKETLTSVDLSFNKIEAEEGGGGPVEFFSNLPNVSVIYFHGNPMSHGMKGYRRSMILSLPQLKYLDERPVFAEERRVVEAWGAGGDVEERREREAIRKEKRDHLESCVRVLYDRMEENREVRDRLTRQWEERRAVEEELMKDRRRVWRVQREELLEAEELDRKSIRTLESDAYITLEEELCVAKKALDIAEAARQKALAHEQAVEAVRAVALKEIEEEEEKALEAAGECAPRHVLMSDEDMLQEMEEEIFRVLGPIDRDPFVGRTGLKVGRAVSATAARLQANKPSVNKAKLSVWEKFSAWERRTTE